MKKTEKIAILTGANANTVLELNALNEYLKKIKASLKATVAYKQTEGDISALLDLINKVRLGAVITRAINTIVKADDLDMTDEERDAYNAHMRDADKDIEEIIASGERLVAHIIAIMGHIMSGKTDKLPAIYDKTKVIAERLIERTNKSLKAAKVKRGVETIYSVVEDHLASVEARLEEEEEERTQEEEARVAYEVAVVYEEREDEDEVNVDSIRGINTITAKTA